MRVVPYSCGGEWICVNAVLRPSASGMRLWVSECVLSCACVCGCVRVSVCLSVCPCVRVFVVITNAFCVALLVKCVV